MKTRMITFTLLLLMAFVVAACSTAAEEAVAPTPTTEAMTETVEKEMMEDESMTEDEHMESDDEMAKGDEMAGEEKMDEDSAMHDESMEGDKEMDGDDEMAEDEHKSSDGEMMEDGDMGEDAMEGDEMAHEDDMDDTMMHNSLSLDLHGLEALGEGWAYEGWLIVDGAPISTGVFNIDDEMMATAGEFEVDAETLSQATTFVLTIEPSPDSDPAPSQVHVLGGDFDGDSAALTVAHPAALGNDFADIDSTYILGIPSSDSADDSYTSGIWFTGLSLPELPTGWVYEGWVAGPDGPITTGRFTTGNSADSDGTGPTAGPKPGPAYPGQDYLNPAIDLTSGFAAVISIEPEPDDSPAPFALKPLVDETIEDAGDHVPQEFMVNTAAFPTGVVNRGDMMMESDS